MIITISFDVRNHVEVMESWPIKNGDLTFHLDRKGNIVQKACISFSNVDIKEAPKLSRPQNNQEAPTITMRNNDLIKVALKRILNWQAVVIGHQVFDLDFDCYEIQFIAETPVEQEQIQIKSFRNFEKDKMNRSSDFEQIGRAFCVDEIDELRIESTSHFREGRIAYESGRFIDSYNNMFLFLETRYCDGKTKTTQQVELLSKNATFCEHLERLISEFEDKTVTHSKHLKNIFEADTALKEKIKTIVLLRGNLRHHSLKSTQRWNPNQQDEYEAAARFLGAVVGGIVLTESLNDIYAPKNLEKFRKLSIDNGFESKIKVTTNRLEKKPTLSLEMSFPVTVISSQLCKSAVEQALSVCQKNDQLADTVRLEAEDSRTGLELFTLELGIWAYTQSRTTGHNNETKLISCHFEILQSNTCTKHSFSMPLRTSKIDILRAWNLLKSCFDWIEQKDPTTRILSLKLLLNDRSPPFLVYKVGAQVKN